LLEGGLVVVDTPGLGSLATAGAAETLAYLPRCDVGLVLIDAAAPLSAEDVGTLERLDQAGIPAHLLLSKADLLAPADLARVVAYVEEQLTRRLGRPVPVRPISVMDAHAHLLDEWTSTGLEPLVSEHRRLARASVHRKIGALRQAVTATLEARRARARGAGDHRSLDAPAIEEELRRAAARFEQARLALDAYRDLPERVASEALREAAREVVASNGAHPGADGFAAAVKAAVAACVSRHFEPVGHELLAVATAVTDALEHASRKLEVSETPGREDWAALVREMPRLDLESLAVPAEGRWAGALGEAVRARRLYGRLRARLGDSLGETLHAYALVVHAWADRILAQYRREFEAQADMCRVQLAGRAGTAGEGDADRLDADLRRLAGPDERRTREASI
jgi:hypothetical protein